MDELFLTIAEITLAMTPLLALAWLFARLGKRFSAGCRYAVWCILLLRLAIPLNFTLPTPVLDLAPPAVAAVTPVEQAPVQLEIPAQSVTVDVNATPALPPVESPATTVAPDMTKILPILWLLGALAVLGWQLAGHGMAVARLRRWMRPVADARLTDALTRAKANLGMRRPVKLWLCAEVSSPMLRGLISPEILLPHGDYTDEQLDAIFTHELIHCRRGDLVWKVVAMAATSLHFFNPLVHMAAREMEIEMEQACDDAVFRYDEVSRRSYAETMLTVARQGLATPQRGLNTHFHGPAKALKGRFANILDSSAKRAGIGIIAATLVVALLIGALVSCRSEEAPSDHDPVTDAPEESTTDTTDPAVEISTDTAPVTAPFSFFSLYAPIATENYLSVDNSSDTYLRYTTGYRAPVFTPAAGEIIGITDEAGGFSVTIRHENGFTSRLTGLDSVAVTVGTALDSSAYLGQAANPVTLYLNDAAGQAIDPENYLHWPRKIDYIYPLHDSLPILHSWSSEIGNYLDEAKIGILGNHHNMLTYVLESLYGKDHDFGQLSLTTEQLTVNGKTYRYIWRAHQGSRGYVAFAIADDMTVLVSEYRQQTWNALRITEKGAFLDETTITATPAQTMPPLFPDEVWFVTDPANSVVLTGIATVCIEPITPSAPVTTWTPPVTDAPTTETTPPVTAEPVQTSKVSSKPGDRHIYDCIMPIDAIMDGGVWEMLSGEYDILLAYIRKIYTDQHCSELALIPRCYTGYPHVWRATVGKHALLFAMNDQGAFVVGQVLEGDETREQKFFSTPTADGLPQGSLYLTLSTESPLCPWDITFPVE